MLSFSAIIVALDNHGNAMIRYLSILLLLLEGMWAHRLYGQEFKAAQQRYPRVREAYSSKYEGCVTDLKRIGITTRQFSMYIRAFKAEEVLEVWAKSPDQSQFHLLKTFDFCATSGQLGPKRRQGDYQIPEGIYHIDRFNPASVFHLSLGINYPNAADRIHGKKGSLGGDIFIHGACVTIGCIPITDQHIKTLYLWAVEAKTGGQNKIPVHIFPFKMSETVLKRYLREGSFSGGTQALWKSLAPIYNHFETHKVVPKTHINSQGAYQIKP